MTTETLLLCAVPYDTTKAPFYFKTEEEFDNKAKESGAEEFEIQYIDGDESITNQRQFCNSISQCNIGGWLEQAEAIAELESTQRAALQYLTRCLSQPMGDALEAIETVELFEGTASDYAYDLATQSMPEDAPKFMKMYFDYDAYKRDLELEGSIHEFRFEGTTYTVTNCFDL